jgi:hypothetical protein
MSFARVTALIRPVDADAATRTLRGVIFATTGLASDGMILIPSGMELTRFLANPVITDRHLLTYDGDGNALPVDAEVIAAAEDITAGELEISATVRFADTQAGREFASLYGCNEERRAWMRAWSVEVPILEMRRVSWEEAKRLAGPYWDESLAARLSRLPAVGVGLRSELKSVAVVPVGADRGALTRAAREGNLSAGLCLARLETAQASNELDALKMELVSQRARLDKLEDDLLALRSDGAAAAARGDTAGILNELRAMRLHVNEQLNPKGAR